MTGETSQTVLAQTRDKRFAIPYGALAGSLGVFGKDVLRYSTVVFAIAVAGMTLILANEIAQATGLGGFLPSMLDSPAQFYFTVLVTTAFCIGIVLGTDEEESRTRLFLDQLPISRLRLLGAKSCAGLGLFVAAAVLNGLVYLLPYGLSFLHEVFTWKYKFGFFTGVEHAQGFVLAHAVSLIATGLVAGAYFGSLTPAALGGALFQFLFMLLFEIITRTDQMNIQQRDNTQICGLTAWTVLCFVAYPSIISYRRAHAGRRRTEIGFLDRVGEQTGPGTFVSAETRLLRSTTFYLCCASLVMSIAQIFLPAIIVQAPAALVVMLGGALLGSGAWTAAERDSTTFFTYALPVSREAMFRKRMLSLLGYLSVLSLFSASCFVTSIEIFNDRSSTHTIQWRAVGLVIPGLACCILISGVMACVTRLFHRLRLVSIILAGIWMLGILAPTLGALRGSFQLANGPSPQFEFYVVWCILWALAIPLVAAYLAFCRTRLLEQPERRRGFLSIAMVLVLSAWGVFIITCNPFQLYLILMN